MSKFKPTRFDRRARAKGTFARGALLLLPLGSIALAEGPCDIYAAAGTPCVAAHAMTRALSSNYAGPLYQVRRGKDGALKDIPVKSAGGYVDASVQEQFCAGTTCTVSIIYDQTTNHNDLKKSGVAHWLPKGGNEADASKGQIKIDGHTAYGIYVTAYNGNVAYRNNATKGVATGNQAEAMYAVVDGKRYSSDCCFDYGNAETTGNDDGNGTMEAIYWGTDVGWGGHGQGNGPWIADDLENGMFKGNAGGWQYGDTHKTPWPTAKSVIANFANLVLKGPSTNKFGIKAGDAQSGKLTTMWDDVRPTPGYSPKKLQGAIILGTGGDGSNGGTGTFYEGAMTIGNPPDSTDDKIQANVVAAGYGRTTAIGDRGLRSSPTSFRYDPSSQTARFDYNVEGSGHARLRVVDLQGREVARPQDASVVSGEQVVAWDASGVRAGVYAAILEIDGNTAWSGHVLVGR